MYVFVQTWPIVVNEGQRIKITFLHFNVEECSSCSCDWVELKSDIYISKHCGQTSKPWTIITNINTITVTFISDGQYTQTGFALVWTATIEPPTYPSTGCDSCTFPFVLAGVTFDTCVSVQDVDTQPWCSYNISIPEEGTHIFPYKITCSDSDSSCPSSPPQTVISSPRYPLDYPANVDQVK